MHLSSSMNGVTLWMDENDPLVFRPNVTFLIGGLVGGKN